MKDQDLDILQIVANSCSELAIQYQFAIEKTSCSTVILSTTKCGIKIVAGLTPIGDYQIEIKFFDPIEKESTRKYYSHTSILYNITRKEPLDIIDSCEKDLLTSHTISQMLTSSLKCFTLHSLKYRKDILSGDFQTLIRR